MEQKAWIIDEKTAKQYLTVEDAIDCVEKTWKWYGEGRVIMPNKITTDMSELGVAGWFNSMPAYIGGDVKVGGGNFCMIAGPCSVESEEQILSLIHI